MAILTELQLAAGLVRLPQWTIRTGKLTREWTFQDFAEAMQFVNLVAQRAEASNHHPDLDIRYNRVRVSLISYDVGGLTGRDLQFATLVNDISL